MGFIRAISSLVSPNAWVIQYAENFQLLVKTAGRGHPDFPRCALLAIGWMKQFNLPFCPVPEWLNYFSTNAQSFGSLYSCLDKPCDSEALALHAVLEVRIRDAYDKAQKAFDEAMRDGGDAEFGVSITDIIGEKFAERYKELTRPIVEDLANGNFYALQQKFAARNPNGSRYFIDDRIFNDARFNRQDFEPAIKKLPDSYDLRDMRVWYENATGVSGGVRFGVGEDYFSVSLGAVAADRVRTMYLNEGIVGSKWNY